MSIVMTGEGIKLVRLMSIRSMIILEMRSGLRWKVNPARIARKELGLAPRAKREVVLEALDKAIAEQKTKVKPGDIEMTGLPPMGGGSVPLVLPTEKPKSPPYPWCWTPEKCVNIGYCPRDPNCGE